MIRDAHAAAVALIALTLVAAGGSANAAEKRAKQEYGAPEPSGATETKGVILWVPRVVLFPLWLTSEFLVRRPVGALVRMAERDQWPEDVLDFFTFGDRRQITILPSGFVDFGMRPSVGFNARWRYFLTDPNTLALHFGTWGPEWIAVRIVDSYDLTTRDRVAFDARVVERQDNPFYGLGPRSSADAEARYASTLLEAAADVRSKLGRSSVFEARAGVRGLSIGEGTCCGQPSIRDNVNRGLYAAPPGLGESYLAEFQHMSLALDSRKPRPEPGSGVRLEVHGEGVFAPGDSARRAWVKYGAEGGAFLDIPGAQRVLSLSAAVELVDPLVGTVPFPDQVMLGGERPMRGFLRGRLVDRSSAVAQLHYTWPIWVYLDGVIEIDVGNVFDAGLRGFELGLCRLSSGVGIRSSGDRATGFEILVAGGTDPFDQGFRVSSFRFFVGSHHGF